MNAAVSRPTQQRLVAAALAATLWHPPLALAAHRVLSLSLPDYAGTLPLVAGAVALAWLFLFLGEFLFFPAPESRWFHVDRIIADPARGLRQKLSDLAASWMGRVLFAGLGVDLGVLALVAYRSLAG